MEEKKEKIVLSDGTEIEIENGGIENQIQVNVESVDSIPEIIKKFTEENLENYKIKNEDGLTCAIYENKHLVKAVVEPKETGFIVTFNLADVDMIEKRLSAVEAGQELQDGAISDLGDAVSDLAEGGL